MGTIPNYLQQHCDCHEERVTASLLCQELIKKEFLI